MAARACRKGMGASRIEACEAKRQRPASCCLVGARSLGSERHAGVAVILRKTVPHGGWRGLRFDGLRLQALRLQRVEGHRGLGPWEPWYVHGGFLDFRHLKRSIGICQLALRLDVYRGVASQLYIMCCNTEVALQAGTFQTHVKSLVPDCRLRLL